MLPVAVFVLAVKSHGFSHPCDVNYDFTPVEVPNVRVSSAAFGFPEIQHSNLLLPHPLTVLNEQTVVLAASLCATKV